MPDIKLWILSIVLGLVLGVPHVYGFMKPAEYSSAMRKFPRYTPAGYLLMVVATLWFLGYVRQESISDFASFKPVLFIVFAAVGICACLFVKDFLAIRGLAVVFLLLAKLMVDSARWVETPWRLVVVTFAYGLVVAGMWFTVSPWRLRDLINWTTANEQRTKLTCAIRAGFGLLLVVLGLTVFRHAEQRAAERNNSAQHLTEPTAFRIT